MGLIYKDVWFDGRKGRHSFRALFDSGSSHCLMRTRVAEQVDFPDELSEPKKYEAAVGEVTARHFVVADVEIEGKRLTQLFKVVPTLSEEVIIGVDFMQQWQVKLDPHSHRLHVDPRALRLKAVGMRVPRRRK